MVDSNTLFLPVLYIAFYSLRTEPDCKRIPPGISCRPSCLTSTGGSSSIAPDQKLTFRAVGWLSVQSPVWGDKIFIWLKTKNVPQQWQIILFFNKWKLSQYEWSYIALLAINIIYNKVKIFTVRSTDIYSERRGAASHIQPSVRLFRNRYDSTANRPTHGFPLLYLERDCKTD